MEKQSEDFILNTLKGKIWLAVGVLAIFNCVGGFIAYIASSLISSGVLISLIISVAFTIFTTLVFGKWISSEILGPIEKINLLAKSIERSPSFSLPKTTGSSETDELLQTLHRNSQQIQNLIRLMDDVAAGRTETALTPLADSDRLCASFQKLVSKVTDSIDAKNELDELRSAVNQIGNEISGIHNGGLVEIRSDFPATKKIADAFKTLIARHENLTLNVQANSAELTALANESRKLMRKAIEKNDSRTRGGKPISASVQKVFDRATNITREVSGSLLPIAELSEVVDFGAASASNISETVASLRKQIGSTAQKVQDFHGQCQAISQVSRSTRDIARRSKMIALNTSIYSGSENRNGGFPQLAEEVGSLAESALEVDKEISTISETLVRGIGEAQASLLTISSEMAKVSRQSSESEDVSGRLKSFLGDLAKFPARMSAAESEQAREMKQLSALADDDSAVSAEIAAELRACEQSVSQFLQPLENLRESIARKNSTHFLNVKGHTAFGASDESSQRTPADGFHAVELSEL